MAKVLVIGNGFDIALGLYYTLHGLLEFYTRYVCVRLVVRTPEERILLGA